MNCCLYSFQSLIENRPPDIYPYESDDFDSESFSEEISEGGEDEESDKSDDGVTFVKVVPTKSPSCDTKGKADCPVKQGLCNELQPLFKIKLPFFLPHYMGTQVDAILKGLIAFHGSCNLISMDDLQSLVGNSDTGNTKDKWLTNFVTDEYFKLIQSAGQDKDVKVKTVSWELLKRARVL